jgi:hypothetical protein
LRDRRNKLEISLLFCRDDLKTNGHNHPSSLYLKLSHKERILHHFAPKPKPRKTLKALQSNTFKVFLLALHDRQLL